MAGPAPLGNFYVSLPGGYIPAKEPGVMQAALAQFLSRTGSDVLGSYLATKMPLSKAEKERSTLERERMLQQAKQADADRRHAEYLTGIQIDAADERAFAEMENARALAADEAGWAYDRAILSEQGATNRAWMSEETQREMQDLQELGASARQAQALALQKELGIMDFRAKLLQNNIDIDSSGQLVDPYTQLPIDPNSLPPQILAELKVKEAQAQHLTASANAMQAEADAYTKMTQPQAEAAPKSPAAVRKATAVPEAKAKGLELIEPLRKAGVVVFGMNPVVGPIGSVADLLLKGQPYAEAMGNAWEPNVELSDGQEYAMQLRKAVLAGEITEEQAQAAYRKFIGRK